MAEKITINVPHKLTREDARRRIDSGFAKVQEQVTGKTLEMEQSWQGDTMQFTAAAMGQNITGRLNVEDTQVKIEVDLPWILAKLSGAFSDKLKKQTQLLLDKK